MFSENHDSSLMIFSEVSSDSRITYEDIIIHIEIISFVFLFCCPCGINAILALSLLGLQLVKKF